MPDRHALPIPPDHADRAACLAELRRQIVRIERGQFDTRPIGGTKPAASGIASPDPLTIDPLLTGGAAGPTLQELVADSHGSQPAVRDLGLALAAALLHRQQRNKGMVLWCERQQDALEFGQLYGPGLMTLGLPPDRLLMVTGRRDADCLWAMEQGLASKSLVAVIGMVNRASLTASRRLSLAARAHGTWCLLLPLQHGRDPSAARTRWRIKTATSTPDELDPKGLGPPRWELALERSENGNTGRWIVEWDHATHHFHLAAAMAAARRSSQVAVAEQGGPDKHITDVIAFHRTG